MELTNYSYRSLERLCRTQAAMSATEGVKRELERMAEEYRVMADYVDGQQANPNEGTPPRWGEVQF